jgi:uncharacterized protein YgbK (DUF1537 family)
VHLAQLRSAGGRSIADPLIALAERGSPAVCVPDAETIDDLRLVAEGLRLAQRAGADVVVRSSPAFVGVAAGTLATAPALVPAADCGLLVVCGSWTALSTRQLETLVKAHPRSLVEVDVCRLASKCSDAEIERAAAEVSKLLALDGFAIAATDRTCAEEVRSFEAGERIAAGLAEVVASLERMPGVVVAKGGITSHVTARVGLRAKRGTVVGPLVEGVALWQLDGERSDVAYVVFPGNVGRDGTLLEVVDAILGI